jgi:hypothetical protein
MPARNVISFVLLQSLYFTNLLGQFTCFVNLALCIYLYKSNTVLLNLGQSFVFIVCPRRNWVPMTRGPQFFPIVTWQMRQITDGQSITLRFEKKNLIRYDIYQQIFNWTDVTGSSKGVRVCYRILWPKPLVRYLRVIIYLRE